MPVIETIDRSVAVPDPPSPTSTETGPTDLGPNASFLGLEPDLSLPEPEEQNPEPLQTEGQETEGETVEQEAEQPEAQLSEETDDNWLPTEQEKEFPLATLQRYGPRYGYTAAEIAADPRLQNLVKDKINTDIYVQQLTQEDQQLEEQVVDSVAAEAPQTAADPAQAYQQEVDRIVSTVVSPQAMQQLGMEMLTAFGANPNQLKQIETALQNRALTPQQRQSLQSQYQELKTLVDNAPKVGQTLARGAVDLIKTVVPQLLPQLIEQVYPGTEARFESQLAADAWNSVTQTKGTNGQALYPNLPAYRTTEFQSLMRKTERELGLPKDGLAQMFSNLPKQEAYSRTYSLVAKVAAGQQVTPAVMAQAVETGRRMQTQTAQRRAVGRALGAGRAAGQPVEEQDPMRSALRDQIGAFNHDSLAVSNLQR